MSLVKRAEAGTSSDESFEKWFRDLVTGGVFGGRLLDAKAAMRVEEHLTDNLYTLRVEAPGIDPEQDVDISVVDGVLHISVRREEKREEKDGDGYRSEFRYGSFARSMRLPSGADEKAIEAHYNDGILEVRVPVPQPVQPAATKVPVTRG